MAKKKVRREAKNEKLKTLRVQGMVKILNS